MTNSVIETENHIGDDGVGQLCEALKSNTTLTVLDLESDRNQQTGIVKL